MLRLDTNLIPILLHSRYMQTPINFQISASTSQVSKKEIIYYIIEDVKFSGKIIHPYCIRGPHVFSVTLEIDGCVTLNACMYEESKKERLTQNVRIPRQPRFPPVVVQLTYEASV